MSPSPNLHLVKHPLIDVHLAKLRDAETSSDDFRRHLHIIGQLMIFEVTRHLETEITTINTPLEATEGAKLKRPIVLVPILRAGLGMLNGILTCLPEAQIGHIGMCRNEETHTPESYYCNLPANIDAADVILIDPMLATGNSSVEAARQLINQGAKHLSFINLVSCPEGIEQFHKELPDIPIYTAAVDSHLNENAYIVPGLGDAGDRYFGTL
ncbi:MAG: uracil phosphoribosyltransferase [Verrucomicrobiota bacterium]